MLLHNAIAQCLVQSARKTGIEFPKCLTSIYYDSDSLVACVILVSIINVRKIIQSPTRIPEIIVVGLFSGILVNSGIVVEAGRLHNSK